MKKPTIEVSMIVKNEEVMLPACLESIQGVDFITIADTGSEDKTVDIAKKYTDRVYTEYKWNDNFAEARNFSLSKCTGDWILIIDADEVLKTDIKHLREEVEKADKQGHIFINIDVKAKKKAGMNRFPRLFKNVPEVEWKGVAHNYLNYNGESVARKYESDICIEYGYSPAHKKDPDRTLRILKKYVKENPKATRERYYLAREYYYRQNWMKCMEHLDVYIPLSHFIGERNDAWLMKAYCMAGLQKWSDACDCAWQAIKYNANFKEALVFIANHMDSVNKETWLKFSEIADNKNVLFIREVNNADK